jgi:hypothetical protein
MVNGNNNVKEWTGVHSSLVVSLHKINNMLGKQITVGCYSCDGARKELWRLVDVGAVSPCAW